MNKKLIVETIESMQNLIDDALQEMDFKVFKSDFDEEVYDKLTAIGDELSEIADALEDGKFKPKLEGRIKYVEDFDDSEAFVFETKHTDEDEWGLDTAFTLIPRDDDPHNDLISYQALTKIREWMRIGISVRFGV